MKINKENQQRKSTGKFFDGIKFALGILFVFSIVGIVYAVGFHFPYEILPGQFANGNYSFNGSLGIGINSPSSLLHLASGTSSIAPLKLTTGTLLSTVEDGVIEYDGTNLYFTILNQIDTVPQMTSYTLPEGVVSTSSEWPSCSNGGSCSAWKAFDNNLGTGWTASNAGVLQWIKYDFGVGKTENIVEYRIYYSGTYPANKPTNWTFEGSYDDSSWSILDTQVNQDYAIGWTNYSFSNSNYYRYYRLFIPPYVASPHIPAIEELELLENTRRKFVFN